MIDLPPIIEIPRPAYHADIPDSVLKQRARLSRRGKWWDQLRQETKGPAELLGPNRGILVKDNRYIPPDEAMLILGMIRKKSAGELLTWDSATKHGNVTLSNGDLTMTNTGNPQNAFTQAFDSTGADLYCEISLDDKASSASTGCGMVGDNSDNTLDLYRVDSAGDAVTLHRRGGGGGNVYWITVYIDSTSIVDDDSGFDSGSNGDHMGWLMDGGDAWAHQAGVWYGATSGEVDARTNELNPSNALDDTTSYFVANPDGGSQTLVPASTDWSHAPSGAVEIYQA